MPAAKRRPRFVVTIDGPGGSGKSTVARGIAAALGIHYLDTGAMYRGLTLKALREGVDPQNARALARLARRTRLAWRRDRQGRWRLLLDGADVSRAIRSPETTKAVSAVSQHRQVRRWMVRWQRRFAREDSVVVEGRDIGTVVFPGALYKFFLIASPTVRARRRWRELRAAGVRTSLAAVLKSLQRRDTLDRRRSVSPLRCPSDAIRVDTSRRTVDETVAVLLRHIQASTLARSS